MPLRVAFAGTPAFAAAHLSALLESRHEVVGVYTQPDRPAGRGRRLMPSPVKALAGDAGLPVAQPKSFKEPDALDPLREWDVDVMVVVAYGLLLPQSVLDTPRLGCINVHASLLPRWRGAAPIHRAVLAGDATSGVTIMQMDAGLDTGDMLVSAECSVAPRETSASLHDKLIELGGPALVETLDGLEAGTVTPTPQNDADATYATKLTKAEGRIDWRQPAEAIDRQIRGLTPWPGAFTHWRGETVRLHQAHPVEAPGDAEPGSLWLDRNRLVVACGEGALALDRLQLPGKKAMAVGDVLNARRDAFEHHPFLDSEPPA